MYQNLNRASAWCQLGVSSVSARSQLGLSLVSAQSNHGTCARSQLGLSSVSTWSQLGLSSVSAWFQLDFSNCQQVSAIHFNSVSVFHIDLSKSQLARDDYFHFNPKKGKFYLDNNEVLGMLAICKSGKNILSFQVAYVYQI